MPTVETTPASSIPTATAQVQTKMDTAHSNVTEPKEIFRKDYTVSNFLVHSIKLDFDLDYHTTKVKSNLTIQPNPEAPQNQDLVLDGEDLELVEIQINHVTLKKEDYEVEAKCLKISKAALPKDDKPFTVQCSVIIHPESNLSLAGLYKSKDMLTTQCEPMGFRHITYHVDRPDVMSKYAVTLKAQNTKFPVLLSNGNQIDNKIEGDYRIVTFEDPFPKPSYLFALVAGPLQSIRSTFITKSKKPVEVAVYSEAHNIHRLDWALECVKMAMKWDEDTFNLEYDLNIFNIVAVDDFNMGAMENKSLCIFNVSCLAASQETSTDADYERVLQCVSHEYFHNWTGNRVTCRDWFQLTLKEGLTVFREQWFSKDVIPDGVSRLDDVAALRSYQFPEDAGPMAHCIRPESYISMNNFYSTTIYDKGAEVIRMLSVILGTEKFKEGMALYFQRHDGTAVTCDDFFNAMQTVYSTDISQFKRWYSQAGTPMLTMTKADYNEKTKTFSVTFEQHTNPTPNQPVKLPFLIPIKIALLSRKDGKQIMEPQVLLLKEKSETFTFENIEYEPYVSAFRDLSAPVKIKTPMSIEDLIFALAHETDAFLKWNASEKLMSDMIYKLMKSDSSKSDEEVVPPAFFEAWRKVLKSDNSFRYLQARLISLPSVYTLAADLEKIDPDALSDARERLKCIMYMKLKDELADLYNKLTVECENSTGHFSLTTGEVPTRQLRSTLLTYLCCKANDKGAEIAENDFFKSKSVTEKVRGLSACLLYPGELMDKAVNHFYKEAAGNKTLLDKWFSVQCIADIPNCVDHTKKLMKHVDFCISNPNSARSVVSCFGTNLKHFHRLDGSGYQLVADAVLEVDKFNKELSAMLIRPFTQWEKYDETRQALMKSHLIRIKNTEGISPNVFEITKRCLRL